jgi:hypothetical protein
MLGVMAEGAPWSLWLRSVEIHLVPCDSAFPKARLPVSEDRIVKMWWLPRAGCLLKLLPVYRSHWGSEHLVLAPCHSPHLWTLPKASPQQLSGQWRLSEESQDLPAVELMASPHGPEGEEGPFGTSVRSYSGVLGSPLADNKPVHMELGALDTLAYPFPLKSQGWEKGVLDLLRWHCCLRPP